MKKYNKVIERFFWIVVVITIGMSSSGCAAFSPTAFQTVSGYVMPGMSSLLQPGGTLYGLQFLIQGGLLSEAWSDGTRLFLSWPVARGMVGYVWIDASNGTLIENYIASNGFKARLINSGDFGSIKATLTELGYNPISIKDIPQSIVNEIMGTTTGALYTQLAQIRPTVMIFPVSLLWFFDYDKCMEHMYGVPSEGVPQ